MNIKIQTTFRVDGYIYYRKNIKIYAVLEMMINLFYSWRGAEIKNFLEFDKVYENVKVIRLEENYRSSQNILSVASNLIANNQNRVGKTLKTTMDEGDLVKLNCFKNGKDEAIGISDEIENKLKKKYSFNNIAILVRAIFQTREFEERFFKNWSSL